jgi:uncharacterized phage protein gp47/JayE
MFKKKSYNEIVKDILEFITKGITSEKHFYNREKIVYKLTYSPKEVVKVTGLLNGELHIFENNRDFVVTNDAIKWLDSANANKPDDKSEFSINYIMNNGTSKLTDINPGSVLRTLVESISREIEFLYDQLDYVYRSAFVDTTTGNSLDLVAAIVNIRRRIPMPATGNVVFGRNSDLPEINISNEVIYFDNRNEYAFSVKSVKRIEAVKGLYNGREYTFEYGIDYIPTYNGMRWIEDGKRPDIDSEFYVDYAAYQTIIIPKGTVVSTMGDNAIMFETTMEGQLQRINENRWEVSIPVKALTNGKIGNVMTGSITVIPQPPIGVEYVINRENFSNGTDLEDDNSLRERVKRALEVAGKATLESLRAALKSIEGIQSEPIIIECPDGVEGIVRVAIDGGNDEDIERVIKDTKAAGIYVEVKRPEYVVIDISTTIRTDKNTKLTSSIESEIKSSIIDYISSLKIGDDLIFNKIITIILNIEGVGDIEELTISAYRKDKIIKSNKENITISKTERIKIRDITIKLR